LVDIQPAAKPNDFWKPVYFLRYGIKEKQAVETIRLFWADSLNGSALNPLFDDPNQGLGIGWEVLIGVVVPNQPDNLEKIKSVPDGDWWQVHTKDA